MKTGVTADVPVRINFVTAIMTTDDYADPAEEVQRMLLNVLSPRRSNTSSNTMRTEHVAAWSKIWNVNFTIEPKADLTYTEMEKFNKFRKFTRIAMYNVYACTRSGTSVEVNPANMSIVDVDGSILYEGDMYFLPLLLLVNPTLAKNMLQERFKTIAGAQKLAAAYGFNGTKFEHVTDVMGYEAALYWDTTSAISTYNTPLIAISVWNYYRTTLDYYWLETIGYPLLRNIADYICSIVERTGATACTIVNVRGPSGIDGSDNTYTNYLSLFALKCAIECSYALNIPLRSSWSQTYSTLLIPTEPGKDYILKFDRDTVLAAGTLDIAEPVSLLTPYYSSLYLAMDESRSWSTIKENLTYYEGKVKTEQVYNPYNVIPAAIIRATNAQVLPREQSVVEIERYYEDILAFIDRHADDMWGNLTRSNFTNSKNDLNLSAMLVLSTLLGPIGFKIKGGVTETRFYYEDMGVDFYETAVMPRSWDRVVINRIGGVVPTIISNVIV
jgi:hypothetical protein